MAMEGKRALGAVVAFDLVDVFMKHLKYDTFL